MRSIFKLVVILLVATLLITACSPSATKTVEEVQAPEEVAEKEEACTSSEFLGQMGQFPKGGFSRS